jgi:ABC-type glycerol-3-phosphate transport system permease component
LGWLVGDAAHDQHGVPPGRRRGLGRGGFALYLTGGTLAALVFLLPLAWAILRSFMPNDLVTQAPSAGDFSHLTTANYSGIITTNDILRYADHLWTLTAT